MDVRPKEDSEVSEAGRESSGTELVEISTAFPGSVNSIVSTPAVSINGASTPEVSTPECRFQESELQQCKL
jgi:hypothetical protein